MVKGGKKPQLCTSGSSCFPFTLTTSLENFRPVMVMEGALLSRAINFQLQLKLVLRFNSKSRSSEQGRCLRREIKLCWCELLWCHYVLICGWKGIKGKQMITRAKLTTREARGKIVLWAPIGPLVPRNLLPLYSLDPVHMAASLYFGLIL